MRRAVRARKVTPKVKDGTVQKKHRHALTAHAGYTIVKHAAARGHRHIISQKDIRDFIDIVPQWDRLAQGLESIVLTAHGGVEDEGHFGRYSVFQREKTEFDRDPGLGRRPLGRAHGGALRGTSRNPRAHRRRAPEDRRGQRRVPLHRATGTRLPAAARLHPQSSDITSIG